MPTAPDLVACKAYLGDGSSYSDTEVENARAAELVAQMNACKIPADLDPLNPQPYPADLAEALKRRILRNLTMKALPLGLQTSMSEAAVSTIRVGQDPEVRRLEAPYRKRVVG